MLVHSWKDLISILFALVTVGLAQIPQTDFDVIIVGGGPSGLSAASALSRVLRKSVLFDSGEYRNNPTRHMHDVIGNDHVVPAQFRAAARAQIAFYNTTTFVDQKVTTLEKVGESMFQATVSSNRTYTARKVILGSGMRDELPDTPGLREAFGKGIFWCPWCDGFEHRNQSMGVLGDLSEAYGAVRELHPTLNKDIRVYANGTDTPEQRQKLNQTHPNWERVFEVYNVTINNAPIVNITRIQNGSEVQDPATRREFDSFRIYFADNSSEVRSAFLTNYGTSQTSDLPRQLGIGMLGTKMNTTDRGLQTTIRGVWGVGDANSDNTTNVPHAMASGKKAAVFCHVQMAEEELNQDAIAAKRATVVDPTLRAIIEDRAGSEIEDIYRRLKRL